METPLFDAPAEPEIKIKWGTAETTARLLAMFCAPEYAILKEVAKGTGTNGGRYADAVAMSLYPSRGLHLYGFEVKTSRADWLSELKSPRKAEDIACFCDFWYLVIGSNDIVKVGELPETWGLI